MVHVDQAIANKRISMSHRYVVLFEFHEFSACTLINQKLNNIILIVSSFMNFLKKLYATAVYFRFFFKFEQALIYSRVVRKNKNKIWFNFLHVNFLHPKHHRRVVINYSLHGQFRKMWGID